MDLPLRIPARLVQYSAFQSVFRTLPHYPALGRFPQRLPRSFGYSRPLARSLAPSTDFAEFTLPLAFIPVCIHCFPDLRTTHCIGHVF